MVAIVAIIFFIRLDNSGQIVDVNEEGVVINSDGDRYLVEPSKIKSGGPPKGGIGQDQGIPALAAENINFVSVAEADEWIEDGELVLALEYEDVKRVYPLQILVWHEIVNDVINGDHILVTYCPLCGSGIAYESYIEVDGEKIASRFGTSGKLYNSNLIMYDEETNTYWQQIDGKAIVGDLVGQELKEISIDTVTWSRWRESHPGSEVLSQETGMNRPYGNSPYGGYFESDFLLFEVEARDDRIFAKDFVYGIEIDGVYKAYRKEDVSESGAIEDVVNGVDVRLEELEDGRVVVTNLDSGEEIVKEVDFWFAWYAFHPETELYGF